MLSHKLKYLRKKHNITQNEFAKIFNISNGAIAMWETGKRQPDTDMLKRIATYFNVSVDYLLGLERKDDKKNKETTAIKVFVYGKIPAGIPMEAIEDILDIEEISEEMTKGGKEYFALRISGDSMVPNYLDGDVVIFEKTNDCENGEDCAVMVNGCDATFKRVEKKESGVMLKPLNPEYETYFYTNEQIETFPITICGVARELRRKKLK